MLPKQLQMTYSPTVDRVFIRRCISNKLRPEALEQQLLANGHDSRSIQAYRKAFDQLVEQRRISAFICLGAGAMLGFISCILTLFNAVPSLYHVILYGLTSLGIMVIFIGLYLLLE